MAKIIGIHTPSPVKNYIINGAFDFWQRVAGNTTTINTAAPANNYTADRFCNSGGGGTTKNYSIARSTDVPTFSQSGFSSNYSQLYTQITGIPSPAAGDYICPINYRMEGLDYERLHGRLVTLNFWFKASISGIYSASFQNGAANRVLVSTFVVNAPNTWEYKSITVTLDTTGTWAFDTTLGLNITIGNCSGATFQTSSLNQWLTGSFLTASTAVNWMGTTGATIRIAQISLTEGYGIASSAFQRAGSAIQTELSLCQRYYEKSYDLDVVPGTATTTGSLTYRSAGTNDLYAIFAKQTKRAIPTITFYNPTTGASGTWRNFNANTDLSISSSGFSGSGTSIFATNITGTTAGNGVGGHYVADCDL